MPRTTLRKRWSWGSRPGRGRNLSLALLAAATALALLPACQDYTSGRLDRQADLQRGTFGQDERIAVRIEPGRFLAVDQQPGRFIASVRASAPWPSVAITNGNAEPTTLTLTLLNADPDASVRATLLPLEPGDRRASACPATQDFPPLELAPPRDSDPFSPGLAFELLVPECSRLTLDLDLDPRTETLRIAAIGATNADPTRLDRIAEDLLRWDAHHVVYLGHLGADSTDPRRFDAFLARIEALGIPTTTLPGPPEHRTGLEDFQRTFGAITFATTAGVVPLLFLDTSAGTLATNQFERIETLPEGPEGLAFMTVPPLSPGHPSIPGLRSSQQGVALTQLLHQKGFPTLFASNGRWTVDRSIGPTRTLHLDARSSPSYARIEIENPWARLPCPQAPPIDACPQAESRIRIALQDL